MIIAIDGGAASGKSTVCTLLSQTLGYPYFNAGLVYRAITLWALRARRAASPLGEESVLAALAAIVVRVDGSTTRIAMWGQDVSDQLKSEEVTQLVPFLSSQEPVRRALTALQREIASICEEERGGVIVDGRDATSVVWPDCEVRILLIPEVESTRSGEDTVTRNRLDSHHSDFLSPAVGVTSIPTRRENLEEVAAQILELVARVASSP